jgi:phage I-like protein
MTVLLRAAFANRLEADAAPKWNLLLPKGEWFGENFKALGGSIAIDDAMLAEIVGNWRDAGRPPLPVRKTHLHLDDATPALDRAELDASFGLIEDLRITTSGLEALTRWTDEGRALVAGGRWNFWSAEWQPKHRDRSTGEVKGWWLSGSALTNSPFFNSMPRVAASEVAVSTQPPTPKEKRMLPELKKRLAMALKCAEDCTDEELVASCEKTMGAAVSASAIEEKLTASINAAVSPLQAQLKASLEQVETLKTDAEKAKTALLERDVEALMVSAKSEGKAVEPLREFVVSAAKREGIEAAKKLVAALPVTVALKATGIDGDNKPLSASDAATKLEAIRAANVAAGMTGVIAMESAMRSNPELARAAQALTNPKSKE